MNEIDTRTTSQRYADKIAEFCGSWGFVTWISLGITVWCLLNYKWYDFDKYPYTFLNILLTVISVIQSPIIMMAQNRQAEREHDFVAGIHAKMDKILEKM